MTLSVWSAARLQRYLSGVVPRLLAAPIAAAATWRGSCPHPTWLGRVIRLQAQLAVVGRSAVIRRPVLLETLAAGAKEVIRVEPINLNPRYSTRDIPGKCIKCLAEQELNNCLLELLRTEGDEEVLAQRFEMLVSFLKSPESRQLRDESERYLAEGKQVTVKVSFEGGKPKYELKIKSE